MVRKRLAAQGDVDTVLLCFSADHTPVFPRFFVVFVAVAGFLLSNPKYPLRCYTRRRPTYRKWRQPNQRGGLSARVCVLAYMCVPSFIDVFQVQGSGVG